MESTTFVMKCDEVEYDTIDLLPMLSLYYMQLIKFRAQQIILLSTFSPTKVFDAINTLRRGAIRKLRLHFDVFDVFILYLDETEIR